MRPVCAPFGRRYAETNIVGYDVCVFLKRKGNGYLRVNGHEDESLVEMLLTHEGTPVTILDRRDYRERQAFTKLQINPNSKKAQKADAHKVTIASWQKAISRWKPFAVLIVTIILYLVFFRVHL